jgi:hypothetical protein
MRRACVITATVFGLVIASPLPVYAQAPGQAAAAKRMFDEGVELEKKGDYAGALAKLRAAEQIKSTAGLRYHKAYCLEMTGKLVAAEDEYEAAESLAKETNKTDTLEAIKKQLDPLRPRIPRMSMRLTTPVKDVSVSIDDEKKEVVLLDGRPFRVDPGEHTIVVKAPGYRTFTKKVNAPEAVTTTVDVTLEQTNAREPPPPPPPGGSATPPPPRGNDNVIEPPPEPPRSRSLALPIATTAGAIVLVGVGIGTFLAAGSAQKDGETACHTKTSCDDEKSKVRTLDAVSLGAFIGAVGLGALSVVLWSSGSKSVRTDAGPTWVGIRGAL